MQPIAPRTTEAAAQLLKRGGVWRSRFAILVLFMGLSLPLAYGAFAANDAEHAAQISSDDDVKPTLIAGRWTGRYFGYAAVREKCGGKPCTMTIDLSPCASGWCGVLVKDDGGCGGMAMTVQAGKGDKTYRQYEGHLTLDPKAANYVIQATVWTEKESRKPHLGIVGDTGKEMMFMRRSFPFQAELLRAGDAVCTSEKATS